MPPIEQETQNQDPSAVETQDPPSDQPLTEEPVPGSSPPAGPTSNPYTPQYVQLLEQQLRAQNQQIQELIDRSTTGTPPAPPSRDVEVEKATFYQDPTETTRNIVRQELQQTISPLLDFVKEMKGSNAYIDLKNRFKFNPQWASHFADPTIEAAVDQIMSKAEKNDTNMQAAIIHALGLKATGMLPAAAASVPAPAPTTVPAPPNGGQSVPQPPHLRPSGSQTNINKPAARRQLNELEKRLARERWPNDPKAEERYLNFLELPADQVVMANQEGKVEPKK